MDKREKVFVLSLNVSFSVSAGYMSRVAEKATEEAVNREFDIFMKDRRRANTCWRNIVASIKEARIDER